MSLSTLQKKHAEARKIVRREMLLPSYPHSTGWPLSVRSQILYSLVAMNQKLAEVFEIPTTPDQPGYDAIADELTDIQTLTTRTNYDALEQWMKTHLAPQSKPTALMLKNRLWPYPTGLICQSILVNAMGNYIIAHFAQLYTRLQTLGLR